MLAAAATLAAKRRCVQAAEKLMKHAIFPGFVTGHDFSRADKANQINAGL
jgi:hypothetical protein